jgi:putative PIN family toxin of toxin-antitoxin system
LQICNHLTVSRVIVVDTDVFVSALRGRGAANDVVAECLRTLSPLMGAALFAEYESVFQRQRLFARSRLSGAEREELLDIFLAACRWTRVYYAWRPNLRDESDNPVVELAVAGAASAIVTRNVRDFRIGAELKFPGLEILTPAQLLRGEP